MAIERTAAARPAISVGPPEGTGASYVPSSSATCRLTKPAERRGNDVREDERERGAAERDDDGDGRKPPRKPGRRRKCLRKVDMRVDAPAAGFPQMAEAVHDIDAAVSIAIASALCPARHRVIGVDAMGPVRPDSAG